MLDCDKVSLGVASTTSLLYCDESVFSGREFLTIELLLENLSLGR